MGLASPPEALHIECSAHLICLELGSSLCFVKPLVTTTAGDVHRLTSYIFQPTSHQEPPLACPSVSADLPVYGRPHNPGAPKPSTGVEGQ